VNEVTLSYSSIYKNINIPFTAFVEMVLYYYFLPSLAAIKEFIHDTLSV
jgi:hypothetical protein